MRGMTETVLVKAVLMSVVASAFANGFVGALVLVVTSATITGLFTLRATWVQIRENRRLHQRLDQMEGRQTDIAGAVGVDKRRDDDAHDRHQESGRD